MERQLIITMEGFKSKVDFKGELAMDNKDAFKKMKEIIQKEMKEQGLTIEDVRKSLVESKRIVKLQSVDGKVKIDEENEAQVKWFEEFKREE